MIGTPKITVQCDNEWCDEDVEIELEGAGGKLWTDAHVAKCLGKKGWLVVASGDFCCEECRDDTERQRGDEPERD